MMMMMMMMMMVIEACPHCLTQLNSTQLAAELS